MIFQLRHASPGVKHVRHPIAAETIKVLGFQKFLIPNLHGVAKLAGQRRQEGVQALQKLAQIGKDALCDCSKFENQYRNLSPVRLERSQKSLLQQIEVEKGGILATALRAIPRMAGKQPARNLFRNLEGELESCRRLRE